MFHARKSAAALAFTADDLLLAGLRGVAAGGAATFTDGIRVTPVLTIMIDTATAQRLSACLAELVASVEADGARRLSVGTGVATEPTRDERLVLALVSSCQCRDRRVGRAAAYHLTGGLGEGRLLEIAEEVGQTLRACGLRLCPVALSMVDALAPGALEAVT